MENQLGWTTIEQSEKLIEAGLDLDTADMWYDMLDKCTLYPKINEFYLHDFYYLDREYPCWSLGRLIELMPEIAVLARDSTGNIPSYFMSIMPSESGEDIFMSEQYSTPIEAAVSTIIWLFENNYIKKGETKRLNLNRNQQLKFQQKGTESVEFSIYRSKPDEYNRKHRIELHLTYWYKTMFGDSWDECIDKAIEWIKTIYNEQRL